jgi:glycerol-3-phosphate acyltransferase PlsY
MREILFFAISYLLGSIPFGYLFVKIFKGKNVLEIGWRKTSASNVAKHVSMFLGVLAGILDVLKGSLAVLLPKYLGFDLTSQAVCGIFAIVGHNWSIFLKGAGGRGVGTFGGALLVLSPKFFAFSVLLSLPFLLILNSPLATIFLLLSAILFSSLSFNQPLLIFSLASFLIILLKRLSPVSEISLKNLNLVKNRLLYDRDEHLKTKIEKWISKK